jgi:hypothetical protein
VVTSRNVSKEGHLHHVGKRNGRRKGRKDPRCYVGLPIIENRWPTGDFFRKRGAKGCTFPRITMGKSMTSDQQDSREGSSEAIRGFMAIFPRLTHAHRKDTGQGVSFPVVGGSD